MKWATWIASFMVAVFIASYGVTQVTRSLGPVWGCIGTVFSPSIGQVIPFGCDVTGKLRSTDPVAGGCGTGVIDASAGCPLAMFGQGP